MSRPCERCGKEIIDDSPNGWPYAWCRDCCENGTCHHGERPENCDACYAESDAAYDASRLVAVTKEEN